MKTHLIILTILIITVFVLPAQRQDPAREYVKGNFVDSNGRRMPYRLMSPVDIKVGEKYPLVIFLHGSGERGDDNNKQLEHGAALFADSINTRDYPSFVLFPQCKEKAWTHNMNQEVFMPGAATPPISTTEITLMDLIYSIIESEPVDESRIYVIGLSMGGIAAYDLVCRYPRLFAAAVPICGAVNPDRLANARDVNFMIFHGEKDEEIPVICGRGAYKALEDAGADVQYVEFAGEGHKCWDSAFDYPSLIPWLYSSRKRQPDNQLVSVTD